MINVLVFPCGSEVAIEVHRALHFEKNINLIGLSSVEDHGKFVFENYIGDCPFFDNNDFIEKLQKIQDNFLEDHLPCTYLVNVGRSQSDSSFLLRYNLFSTIARKQ